MGLTPVADPRRRLAPSASISSPVATPGALLPGNTRRVGIEGGFTIKGVEFQIGSHLAGQLVAVVRDDTTIFFFFFLVDTGELLIEHPIPEPGTTSVGNGRPRGPIPFERTGSAL